MFKPVYSLICLLLLAFAAMTACEKPPEQLLADLDSAEDEKRQEAIERLGREGGPLAARLASKLSTESEREREAIFAVMHRLAGAALEEMLAKIGYAFESKEMREGFVDYFRGLGDTGSQRLLAELMSTAELETKQLGPEGSVVQLSSLHHRFEAVSLILEGLTNNLEVGRVPELLRHPYGKVRTRAAYLLCLKQWQFKNPQDGIIYFNHLIATLECPYAPEPVEEAARLAAVDFPLFLETEEKFPSGGGARYQILAAAGTEQIAEYLYKQAVATPNEFLLYNYFLVLRKMESEAGGRYARRLLTQKRTRDSLLAVDPRANEGM